MFGFPSDDGIKQIPVYQHKKFQKKSGSNPHKFRVNVNTYKIERKGRENYAH